MKATTLATLAFALLHASTAVAQDYPQRPIRVVIPFAAGGISDLAARAVTEPMARALGQPIIIDNRGGGGGVLGTDAVAKASPDGYTLLFGNAGGLAAAPALVRALPYEPQRDFAPIAMIARGQLLLVANSQLPSRTVGELVAFARASAGGVAYGSPGGGSPPHLAAELFRTSERLGGIHVPYKGSAPMLADLMAGQITFAFDAIATSLPQVRAGRLRALASSGARRSPLTPDLPTMQEAGIANFEVSSFFALVAPRNTPAVIIERLATEALRALQEPSVRERLAAAGLEPGTESTDALARTLELERRKIRGIVESAGIKGD